jgi:hypothetical protein
MAKRKTEEQKKAKKEYDLLVKEHKQKKQKRELYEAKE